MAVGTNRLTLTGFLSALAIAHGDVTALVMPTQQRESRLTYYQLYEASERVAAGLARCGFKRGDALAVWLPNCPEWVVFEFAAARLGVLVVAVNTRYRAEELVHILNVSKAKGIVLAPDFLEIDFVGILNEAIKSQGAPQFPHLETLFVVADPITGRLDRRHHSNFDLAGKRMVISYPELLELGSGEVPDHQVMPDDFINVFGTSGTTSSPKLALHSQEAVVRHAHSAKQHLKLSPQDTMLCALPFCGAFGFTTLVTALAAGATCLVMPVFKGEAAAELMAKYHVTHAVLTGTMLHAILNVPGFDYRRLHAWRRVCSALWKDFEALSADLEAKTRACLTNVYGASELFALVAIASPDEPRQQRIVPGGYLVSRDIEVRAADPDTQEILDHEVRGELQFRGYNVFKGYLYNEAATAAAFTPDGWYRSGDLGYTLPGGRFVYLARMKDSLRLGGFLTDPTEIENYLNRHEKVDAVQVVGVTDPQSGEDIAVAFIKVKQGQSCTAEELIDFCESGIAAYKIPQHFLFVDDFPTTPSANGDKIQKHKLREMAMKAIKL